MSEQATQKRGLLRLIADVPTLIVQLFRDELESLKVELTKKVKGVAIGVALFAVAGVFAFLAVIILLFAAIFAFAQVLPTWAAALIVAGALLLVVLVLVLIGMVQLKRGNPGKTAQSVKRDVNTIKGIGKRD
jgi:cytochrome c biogenesis protein CcdA